MRLTVTKRPPAGTDAKTLSPGSRYPMTVEVPDSATVDDLKLAIAKQVKSMYPDRQRLTFGDKKNVLESGSTLEKYAVKDNDTVYIKDLGPQIGWQTVFYIEYLGPIIFHYIVYNFQNIFYGEIFEHSEIQK
ncbi:3-oxo-5a-steroid 4- dehydrogenase, partial [Coemansia sp. RSA 486]